MLACDPCADCDQPLIFDPTVEVKFINVDSLQKVNTVLEENADQKTTYADLKTQTLAKARSNNDSVSKYSNLVAGGQTQYQELLDAFLARKTILTDSTKLIDSLNTKLTASTTYWTRIKGLIAAGRVKVDTILLLENGRYLTFEDSASNYVLPLLMEVEENEEGLRETNFRIRIKETVLRVGFTYQTEEIVDEIERQIELRALYIEPSTSDSTLFECKNSSCADHETTLTFYF